MTLRLLYQQVLGSLSVSSLLEMKGYDSTVNNRIRKSQMNMDLKLEWDKSTSFQTKPCCGSYLSFFSL